MDNIYRFHSPNPNPSTVHSTDLPYKPAYLENSYKNYLFPSDQSVTKTDSTHLAHFGQASSGPNYLHVREPSPKPYFESSLPSFSVNPQYNVQHIQEPSHKSYLENSLSKYNISPQYEAHHVREPSPKPYLDIAQSKYNDNPHHQTDLSKLNTPSPYQFDFLSNLQHIRDPNVKPQVESNTSKVSSSQYRFDFQSNLPSFREPSPRPYPESTLSKFGGNSQYISPNIYEANPKPYLEHSLSAFTTQPQNQFDSPKLNVDLLHRLDSISTIHHAHELSPKPSDEISPSKINATSQPQFDFQSNLQKLNLVPPKQTDSAPLQIPDEKKTIINLATYSGAEDWSPSAHFKRSPHDISQSPIGGQSKGSISPRPANGRSQTPNLPPKKQPSTSTELSMSQNGSPSRRLNRYGSSERYFEGKTEKIMQKGFERSSSKSPLSRNGSMVSSPVKSNKSLVHANSSHSVCYSPIKKDSQMNLLKDIKLDGSPNVHNKAKVGFGAVKETLNGVLNERDQMKDIVEELKQAIKEEKSMLEKSQENIRFLANYSQCLSKRSGDLDKNTLNTQTVVNRMREEVLKLQEEVNYYNNMNTKINNQADLERELIKFNQQNTKNLKAHLMQATKERDQTKDKTEVSRHDRKKSMEKHQNAVNTHKNIVNTLENHFQKYAA